MEHISIVVLQYNHSDRTLTCLESLKGLSYAPLDIVVVDNGSDIEHYKNVDYWIKFNKAKNITLLANTTNLGYSAGNNVGIQYALDHGADYVLVLNNDVVVMPNLLQKMLDAKADMVGGEQGEALGHTYLSGAVLLIQKNVLQRIGLFDERFFLYYEDLEYSVRARKAGFVLKKIDGGFRHGVSATTSSLGPATLLYYHSRNALLYYAIHGSLRQRITLLFWRIFVTLKQHIKIALGRNAEISRAIIEGFNDYDHGRFGMRKQ